MAAAMQAAAATGASVTFAVPGGSAASRPLLLEDCGEGAFALHGPGLPGPKGAPRGGPLRCLALPEERPGHQDMVALMGDDGSFLVLDGAGGWATSEEPQLLHVAQPEPAAGRQAPPPAGEAKAAPAHAPGGGSPLEDLRRARHEAWLQRQAGGSAGHAPTKEPEGGLQRLDDDQLYGPARPQAAAEDEQLARQLQQEEHAQAVAETACPPQLHRCPGCSFAITWHATHCCAACATSPGSHGPKCERVPAAGGGGGQPTIVNGVVRRAQTTRGAPVQAAEPEPEVGGWGEAPATGRRTGGGQMSIVAGVLQRRDQPTGMVRFSRGDRDQVLFVWAERMALCVGNSCHDQRNNLRFAAVALEKRTQRGPFGMRMPGGGGGGGVPLGMGMGMGGMGMGMGMGIGRGMARVVENPDHPTNKYPQYFQRIDNLSGQVEGLCRGMVTKARQHQREAVRERLIPAAMAKVQEMEDLTRQVAEADQDEMQKVEMLRIIALQRRYLEALDASLGGSTPRPGLPKPDEVLDFSVANQEVSAQVADLTAVVETQRRSLDMQQLLLLSRIACNTGHQLQNLAAYAAEDPSLGELASRIDNLGGQVENSSRSIMVIVHRQEDLGTIPISSRQEVARHCSNAWDNTTEMARLSSSERLRNNSSVAEMAPTLVRLQRSVKWLNESAMLEIERELSFGFGLFGPKLTGNLGPRAPEPPPQAAATSGAQREDSFTYDVVVLGAGPAGVAAAEAAAERGLRCALVEPRRDGIGTATGFNSKVAHLMISEATGGAWSGAGAAPTPEVWRTLARRRREQASAYGARAEERLAAARVAVIRGCARFLGEHSILVSDFDTGEESEITGGFIVVCTGARPRHPALCHVDGRVIHDYRTIEELGADELPSSLVVLGGGIIACETASHMAALGVSTALLAPGGLLKNLDADVGSAVEAHLRERRGVSIAVGCKVKAVVSDGARAVAELEDGSEITAEVAVVALGSTPNTEWLGLEAVPLKLDARGAIEVDGDMRSSVPHVFACGDCCSRGGLLSQAKQQGLTAVSALHRDRGRVLSAAPSRDAPSVIWTVPEVASCGLRGGRAGSFDVVTRYTDCDRGLFQRADQEFFLKIVYEPQGFPAKVFVRGVHIFGPQAEQLVARGAELIGKSIDEAMEATAMPAAATLEEMYTVNLRSAAKRTVDVQAQRPDGGCAAM